MMTLECRRMVDKFRLPDEIVEATRQIYLQGEGHQWILADHLVNVVDELCDHYARIMDTGDARRASRKARAWIIKSLAVGIGVDDSTLRDREVMGRWFPPAIRNPYTDTLTYHQLRACKAAGDGWQDYADWAMENLPAPVALIRARIKGNGHDDPPLWQVRIDKIVHLLDVLVDAEDTPDQVKDHGRAALICLDIEQDGA